MSARADFADSLSAPAGRNAGPFRRSSPHTIHAENRNVRASNQRASDHGWCSRYLPPNPVAIPASAVYTIAPIGSVPYVVISPTEFALES